jgi:flagellar P-ring protein precursor FlgI
MSPIPRPLLAFIALLAAGIGSVQADAAVRLKDIVNFEGSRDNLLVGYGLVVGLNGTGDDVTKSIFTRESVIGMLDRLGVNARDAQLTVRTKNVAAVMVTATLPSSSRQGSRIDVSVSAMGDAKDLQGGTLVGVPMLGADGEVYAVAQGQVSVGGFSAKGAATSISQGVPTAGKVPDGAIVEREIAFDLSKMQTMNIALRNPDFTTAERISSAINTYMHGSLAHATDSGTVALAIPATMRADVVGLVTRLEQLRIEPDQVAKVVIDDANGVIVMGENVKISTVAVAQGNLTVKITETPQVSQPGPLSNGTTAVVPRTDIQVDTGKDRRLAVVPQGITIQELVNSLNALGIGPRDMISILQAIKAAGAMQADLEVH